mmetsp:Transcript_9468/g.10525  ORF Transcript_9468/g.10525 Transcript_9468/m.10525 type:complete len:112 (+) Transcript_9468:266-601(+)
MPYATCVCVVFPVTRRRRVDDQQRWKNEGAGDEPSARQKQKTRACGTGTGRWHYGSIIIDGETTPTIISFRDRARRVSRSDSEVTTTVPLFHGDEYDDACVFPLPGAVLMG